MYSREERVLIDTHLKYFDKLVIWCRNYVKNDPELQHYAEDWVQEAFVRAVRDKTKFLTHENQKGWLFMTCKHIADDAVQRRNARNKHIMFSIDSPDAPPIEDTDARIDHWENRDERDATILKVIGTLTKNEMDVFNDYFLESASQADTAKKLGKSVEAIKAAIRRIREKAKNA